MKKNEILKKLSEVKLSAHPTVITYDDGYVFDVITPQGAGTGFGSMGQWPCFKFQMTEEIRTLVDRKKHGESVSVDMIRDLEFCQALCSSHNPIFGVCPLPEEEAEPIREELIKQIENLDPNSDFFFAFCEWQGIGGDPELCANMDALEKVFIRNYEYVITPYEEMNEEELEGWYDKYSENGKGIAYINCLHDEK